MPLEPESEERKKLFSSGKRTATAAKPSTYRLKEKDIELLDWICEYLGVSKTEALRSAIRSFAVNLAEIERTKGKL